MSMYSLSLYYKESLPKKSIAMSTIINNKILLLQVKTGRIHNSNELSSKFFVSHMFYYYGIKELSTVRALASLEFNTKQYNTFYRI